MFRAAVKIVIKLTQILALASIIIGVIQFIDESHRREIERIELQKERVRNAWLWLSTTERGNPGICSTVEFLQQNGENVDTSRIPGYIINCNANDLDPQIHNTPGNKDDRVKINVVKVFQDRIKFDATKDHVCGIGDAARVARHFRVFVGGYIPEFYKDLLLEAYAKNAELVVSYRCYGASAFVTGLRAY